MTKINLLGYTSSDLEKLMLEMGEKPYRGKQLFKWLYKHRQYDFEMISDLTKRLRQKLDDLYYVEGLRLAREDVSADGTRKFLFGLDDGCSIESVLIPEEDSDRRTICVSTQVGCALGCIFCATGSMGFSRNLTVGEIVGQLLFVRDNFGEDAFTNIVMMGMGEPLLNLQNVVEAVNIISAGDGLSVAAKKVTISTAGIAPKIVELADLKLKSRLAVSLNAATDEKRLKIMPIARSYSLEQLREALLYYTRQTKSRVTFEYILFEGFNDTKADVKAIAEFIKSIPCKINLLAYNPVESLAAVDGPQLRRPSDEKVDWFAKQLYPRAPAVTVRRSRGVDINAACGQLAAKHKLRST
ncbi:MAG: 23S rRNA (adenine(2503)-C(2))-methyltransferase RlmN [Candidatus Zixiibacteriota bacterium]